jgi:hypothetical protein
MLRAVGQNLGVAFMPYLESTLQGLMLQKDSLHQAIRSEVCCLYKIRVF